MQLESLEKSIQSLKIPQITLTLKQVDLPYYEPTFRTAYDGMAESAMKSAPIMSGEEEIRTDVGVVFYISQM